MIGPADASRAPWRASVPFLTPRPAPPPPSRPRSRIEAVRSHWRDPSAPGLLLVAHRGAWAAWENGALRPVCPENSLPAIERAAALGLPLVELDLKTTRDGAVVLIHDARLDRTTTGSGLVADHSLAELQRLRLTLDGAPTSYRIPTLEEGMEAARGRLLVNLDHATRSRTLAALERLDRIGLSDHAVFKGEPALEALRGSGERSAIGMVHLALAELPEPAPADLPGEVEAALRLSGASAIEISGLGVSDRLGVLAGPVAAAIARAPARLWINTLGASQSAGCGDEAALADPARAPWERLVQAGATILQTDAPAELRAWAGSRAL